MEKLQGSPCHASLLVVTPKCQSRFEMINPTTSMKMIHKFEPSSIMFACCFLRSIAADLWESPHVSLVELRPSWDLRCSRVQWRSLGSDGVWGKWHQCSLHGMLDDDMFPNFQTIQSRRKDSHRLDSNLKRFIESDENILLLYFRDNVLIRQWVKTQYSYFWNICFKKASNIVLIFHWFNN